MCCLLRASRCVVPLLCMLVIQVARADPSAENVFRLVADRLKLSQSNVGAWPDEGDFAGPPTAGMVAAYEWLGDVSYYSCAWRGGYYIVQVTDFQGNVFGDEAYAFTRLSDVFTTGLPPISTEWGSVNLWYQVLREFYNSVRHRDYEARTVVYLQYFDDDEPSSAVFYLAHHVVSAYYVNDIDKDLWREALIRHLARVDDKADYPVLALAAATWALAEIGALDANTPVGDGTAPQWSGVMLADLPALLMSHQVPEGEPFAGSFYGRFDHASDGPDAPTAGYAEDTIFGMLGLAAVASDLEKGSVKDDFSRAIAAAQQVLLQGVGANGEVYEHVSRQGGTYHALEGELLQALWSVKQYQDASVVVEAQP